MLRVAICPAHFQDRVSSQYPCACRHSAGMLTCPVLDLHLPGRSWLPSAERCYGRRHRQSATAPLFHRDLSRPFAARYFSGCANRTDRRMNRENRAGRWQLMQVTAGRGLESKTAGDRTDGRQQPALPIGRQRPHVLQDNPIAQQIQADHVPAGMRDFISRTALGLVVTSDPHRIPEPWPHVVIRASEAAQN